MKTNINSVIINRNNNGYTLYNRYYIETTKYYSIIHYNNTNLRFNSVRNAIMWATFDSDNKISLANRILYIDKKIESVKIELEIQRNLTKINVPNLNNINAYQELAHIKKMLANELNELVKLSKSIKNKKINKIFINRVQHERYYK